MSGESKVDLEKYVPSPEALREAADEKAARARLEKALEPEAASPWAGPAHGAVDKAALPSSLGPVVTPAGEHAKKPAGPRNPAWTAIAAIGAVFVPVILVFVLFVKPPPKKVEGVLMTVVPGVDGAAGPDGGGASPGLDEGGTAPAAVSVPSASASVGSPGVAPAVPPVPGTGASVPTPPLKPMVKDEDPYDAAPPSRPAKSGAPSVPAAPAATTAPVVGAPPSATSLPAGDSTAPKGLPYRKKDQ